MPAIRYTSTLSCPHCGWRQQERMRGDACWFFYRCAGCHRILRPKPGDCCVFCSWGDVPCPPRQRQAAAHPKQQNASGLGTT